MDKNNEKNNKKYILRILILNIIASLIPCVALYVVANEIRMLPVIFLCIFVYSWVEPSVVGAVIAFIINRVKGIEFQPLFWRLTWYAAILQLILAIVATWLIMELARSYTH